MSTPPNVPPNVEAPKSPKVRKNAATAVKEDPEAKAISASVALLAHLDADQRKQVRGFLGTLIELDAKTRKHLADCADGITECDPKGRERVTAYLLARFGA